MNPSADRNVMSATEIVIGWLVVGRQIVKEARRRVRSAEKHRLLSTLTGIGLPRINRKHASKMGIPDVDRGPRSEPIGHEDGKVGWVRADQLEPI